MELTVYQCGLEKCAPLQMKRSEPGNHYLFYYILSGRGVLRVEEEPDSILDYALSAGSGFLIEPGKESCCRTFPEGIWEYMWMEFGGSRAGELIHVSGLTCTRPMYTPVKPEHREELCRILLSLVENWEEHSLKTTGYLYIFMDCLIRNSKYRKTSKEGCGREGYVREAVRYIQENYSGQISVEELARKCGLDRSYFGKVFKSVTGQSPQQYIMYYRMERAAERLAAGSEPVSDIGTAVGYPNLLNFSRAFKGVYGVSPREYRQKNHG